MEQFLNLTHVKSLCAKAVEQIIDEANIWKSMPTNFNVSSDNKDKISTQKAQV